MSVSGSLLPPRLTTDTSFLSASFRWNRLWPPADLHSKNSQQGNEPPAGGMQRDYGVAETASKIDCVQHPSSVHKMDTQVTLPFSFMMIMMIIKKKKSHACLSSPLHTFINT